MQIKVFSVPVVGGEAVNDELNAFLRGNKILQVEHRLVQDGGGLWGYDHLLKKVDSINEIE